MMLIIISGLSGSGKSIALQTLEDEGFYCVDNLPLSFLNAFFDKLPQQGTQIKKIAVGIDARGLTEDLLNTQQLLSEIMLQYPKTRIVFLQASDEVLLKRYHETRRRHPLSTPERGLLESIQYERGVLEAFLGNAQLVIDTSNFNVHQLRQELKERILDTPSNTLSIQLESFGFRNGIPLNADFVFDARSLTNPHWDPSIRQFNGTDRCIQDFLDNALDVQKYLETLKTALDQWIPTFEVGTRAYLTLSIGCTGGQHRSVYLIEKLKDYLLAQNRAVIVRHRELKS